MREEANGFLPHLFKKRLTEFAPRTARKNSDLFLAAVCTSSKTPCAGLGPKELASADPTVDVGPVSQTRLRRVKAQSGAKPPRQKGCAFLTTYLHSATAALAAAAASSV